MSETIIGVISDTHGLLRPEAVDALRGVDHILHAGDIGKPEVIEQLEQLAPVTAVRGNVDRAGQVARYPETQLVEVDGVALYVLHILDELDLDPGAADIAAVIHGHSHTPTAKTRRGVLYFNPGSAGPRRFSLPISLGFLHVEGGELTRWEHLELDA